MIGAAVLKADVDLWRTSPPLPRPHVRHSISPAKHTSQLQAHELCADFEREETRRCHPESGTCASLSDSIVKVEGSYFVACFATIWSLILS